MKKWILCGLATSLAACSQGGGGGTSAQAAVCDDAIESAAAGTMKAASVQSPKDPFAAYGKVLLDRTRAEQSEDDSYNVLTPENLKAVADPVHAPYLKSLSAKSDFILKAGTELSVTLQEKCEDSGEIATEIRSANPEDSGAVSPSGVRSYTWTLKSDLKSSDLEVKANGDRCVVGVSDSTRSYVSALPSDPMAAQEGHLKVIEAYEGYDLLQAANTSKPVVIAIIDTGIDMSHEDLKNVLWTNPKEIAGNGIDDDKNGYVDDVNGYNFASKKSSPQYSTAWSGSQHGTHVSGLAAAQAGNGKGVAGVMGSGAKVMMLNVFGSSSGAASSAVANAIRYAADNGADVINMSLGGTGRNAAYESALGYAISKGATVVAAAGNERSELGTKYFLSPAGYGQQYSGMVTIGSIDSTDLSLSTFSNYSPTYVELAAPGAEDSSSRVGVLSTWPGGGYQRIQGTSMASPVAAGGAALAISMMRARGYAPSPATIESILEVSGHPLEALRTKIRDGRVMNLKAMADYINKTYPVGGTISGSGASGGDPGVPGISCQPSSQL